VKALNSQGCSILRLVLYFLPKLLNICSLLFPPREFNTLIRIFNSQPTYPSLIIKTKKPGFQASTIFALVVAYK